MEFIEDLNKQIGNTQIYNKFFEIFDIESINDFYVFLRDNSYKYGFFSKNDNEKIASRHILESIIYIYYIKNYSSVSRETSLIDIGSGPGIPGFIFYCLKERPSLTLLDSSQRRLKIIENYTKEKKINDIKFIYKRIEEFNEKHDFATIRALIPFPFNAKISHHIFKKQLFLFSGKIIIKEKILNYLNSCNLKIDERIPIEELNFLGNRNLIIISHIDGSKKINPVNWKTVQKEMKTWEV
ncbi:MAG: RsmG family class I SAM-dependent methyltransferase [Leptonema sp. (in: bacteria)]